MYMSFKFLLTKKKILEVFKMRLDPDPSPDLDPRWKTE